MENNTNQNFSSKAINDDELEAVAGGAIELPMRCPNPACNQKFTWNSSTPAVCPYCKQPF